MKAVQYNRYGGTDVLEINSNTPKPSAANGQIVAAVQAVSINPVDNKIRAGLLQKMMPVQFPVTFGGDFSGIIVELGEGVTDFKIGDAVYGQAIVLNGGSGSFAEFVSSNTVNTALKPKNASFEEAAALPLAGVSALQALEDHMQVKNGQKVLIHGGAGGIGHIAIQIAKALGAYVATTVSVDDVDFVKTLGADEVIDYKTQNFAEILKDFDAVYDTVGGETTNKSFTILKKGGVLVSMLGQPDKELAQKYGVTAIGQGTITNTGHLNNLSALVDNGKIKVHIEQVFTLEQVKQAVQLQENGVRGKVVLKN